MTTRVYAYLRASTKEQDANRASEAVYAFAADKGLKVSTAFIENESGASLKRPELFRLLEVAQEGDILLVEQVDRLSRLNSEDWQKLRGTIQAKGIRVVALDLPTSHMLIQTGDEFTSRMLDAVNGMMLDMLAAIARKDYEDRKRRQAEGIKTAKEAGAYKGRQVNHKLHEQVKALYAAGKNKSEIHRLTGAARTTINTILSAPSD